MVTAGAMNALSLSILSTVNRGDEVVIPDPGYVSYVAQVLLAGGVPVYVPLKESDDYHVAVEELERVVTKKTKMVMLNSPSNPTGAVEHKDNLRKIAELAIEKNLLVLSDEPYEALVYPPNQHHSIAALPGMRDRTISIFSFSKTYAMTGMRVGYMTGGENLIRQMTKLQEHYVSCVNSVAQKGAIEALRGPQECVRDMVAEYTVRRDALIDGLNASGIITCPKPEGTFYAFPNIGQTGCDAKTLAKRLLTEAKVVTVPGTAFGKNGEGHLRLSFATGIKNVKKAVERIGKFCEKNTIQSAPTPK